MMLFERLSERKEEHQVIGDFLCHLLDDERRDSGESISVKKGCYEV